MKSIQAKLTITILAIFLVALGALGGLNYWKARTIITENITVDMAKQAENSAGDIGDWLDGRKGELTMLAATPVVVGGDIEVIVPFLKGALEGNKAFSSMGYARLFGEDFNASGIRANVASRDYFQQASKGQVWVSDPAVSVTTGNLSILVGVPVKVNGQIVGVLHGTVSLDGLTKKVLAVKVGQTGYALVAQGDGLVIIHPNKELAMKLNPLKDPAVDPQQKLFAAQMAKGEKGLTMFAMQGTEKYYAYAPVPGTKWSLAINVPVAEVSGGVAALTTITLVTIVVVLIVAGLMISWYARRMAKPIREIELVANRIADGDIRAVNLNINSNDEIGRLGQSFEKMTANLRTASFRKSPPPPTRWQPPPKN